MKLKLFLVLTILILSVSLLVSCGGEGSDTTLPDTTEPETTEPVETEAPETEPAETQPPHVHEYAVSNTIKGTCVEDGYEVYSCSCGLSYKNLLPASHIYKQIKSTDGKYTKNLCALCGDYKIVRNQSYLSNLTFDGFTDIKKATNSQKNLEFYTISSAEKTKGTAVIRSDPDGSYMYIYECNYCVWDKTNTITSKKFVASLDVMFESYPKETLHLFSVSYRNTAGKETYNSGIVKVGTDGSLYVNGREKPLSVKLKDKGYNNITIVYDPILGVADVYVNEKLESAGVTYVVMPSDISMSYIRYFDRRAGFAAHVDNLKLYVANTPEFVVPNGIAFPN